MMNNSEIRETIVAYAEANMKKNTAARNLHLSSNGLDFRLLQIKKKTGYDPKKFGDLVRLVELANENR